jgi:Undecaprenyl-phosphate glucose phosphotransferase
MSARQKIVINASARLGPSGLTLSVPIAIGIQIAVDVLSIVATGMLCWLALLQWKDPAGWARCLSASAVIAVIATVTGSLTHLFDFDVLSRPNDHLIRICTHIIKAFLVFLVLAFSFGHIDTAFSRVWFYSFLLSASIVFLLERYGMSRLIYHLGRKGMMTRNLIVVGGSRMMGSLSKFQTAQQLLPWVHVLGVFDDRIERENPFCETWPWLGRFQEVVTFCRDNRVDDILIAIPWGAEVRFNAILSLLRQIPADIHLIPDDASARWMESGQFISYFGGATVLNVMRKPIGGWSHVLKWIEDKTIASALILLTLPVMLIAALAVRLSSPGPILFRQNRLGFRNQLIQVYKFRTLYNHAADANAEKSCTRDDPRVTRVGRFLRRYSIDELPQLFNVLLGNMSLVGPRPHAPSTKAAGKLFHDVVENYAERHKIKPGITGWAQVNGYRGETDTEEKIKRRVEYDLDYIDNWSLQFDLKIMLKTAWIVFNSEAAY